ncbi:hypothetical protein CHUAL_003744 [Chamberlinius hualienensis]
MFYIVDNITADMNAKFNNDYMFRKVWNPFTEKVRINKANGYVNWEVKFPWPLWNRGGIENCKIFAKQREIMDGYDVKMFSYVENISVDNFAAFNGDFAFRKEWDPFTANVIIRKTGHICWETKYPWPLWNREYVFKTEKCELIIDGEPSHMFINQLIDCDEPPRPHTVRVESYWSIVLITPHPNKKNSVKAQVSDKPGLLIPQWLINWTMKTALTKAYSALTLGVEMYMSKRRKESNELDKSANLYIANNVIENYN